MGEQQEDVDLPGVLGEAHPRRRVYVTSEVLRQEQERYLTEIRSLRTLLINGPSGMVGGSRLGYLKSKYPIEYAHLRAIREG